MLAFDAKALGQREKTFLISSNPEAQVESCLRSLAIKLVLVGAGVLVVSLAMMRQRVEPLPANSGSAPLVRRDELSSLLLRNTRNRHHWGPAICVGLQVPNSLH